MRRKGGSNGARVRQRERVREKRTAAESCGSITLRSLPASHNPSAFTGHVPTAEATIRGDPSRDLSFPPDQASREPTQPHTKARVNLRCTNTPLPSPTRRSALDAREGRCARRRAAAHAPRRCPRHHHRRDRHRLSPEREGGRTLSCQGGGQSTHVSAPPHHRSAHDERNTPRGATTAHRVASVRRLVLHHLRHDRSDARQRERERASMARPPSRSTPLHSPATAHPRAACDPRDALKRQQAHRLHAPVAHRLAETGCATTL